MKNPSSTTPRLRFPEFSGEWRSRLLGDVSDVRDGTHDSPKYHKDGYPLITSKNLTLNGEINFQDVSFVSKEDYLSINKRSEVGIGDILFGMIGTIGNPVIVHKTEFAIKNVALIKEKSDLINPFLYQYLRSDYIKKKFEFKNAGGTQKFIALGQIRSLQIPTPKKDEQQKVADFLTKVDSWLTNLKSQKKELETYKKGLLQKIFSQQIRFKDERGKEYPVWETKKIKAILKIGSGRDYKHLETGSVPVFGTGGYMLSVNQKLGTGETVFIGRKGTINKPYYHNGDFWTVDTLFYTYDYTGVIPKFIAILFSKINWLKHNEASGVPSLSKNTIDNIKTNIPNLPEQQKISDFLTSVDKVIESKQNQIQEAEIWKKGLLQKMFI